MKKNLLEAFPFYQLAAFFCLVFFGFGVAAQSAEQINVVTSGGFASTLEALAERFEAETGIGLSIEYGSSMGSSTTSIPNRLARNEAFDVIILSRASLDALTQAGRVIPDSRVNLAYSKIAMAVEAGAPLPDISTVDRFRQFLLAAESVAYSASVSGSYLSGTLWPQLGIWDELEPRSSRIVGERVGAVVARGEAAVGFQQLSELLPINGIQIVGTIPDELQLVSTYSAAMPVAVRYRQGAQALLDFLSSESVASVIEQQGLEPLARPRAHQPNQRVPGGTQ